MSDADLLSRLRSALAELGKADMAPELPFLQLRRARIVVQKVDGRVSLQMVDRGDDDGPEAPDQIVLPVWMGVPGASADHTPGQEVLLAFASADAAQPIAFLAPPLGMASAVPIKVRFEATTEIVFVGASVGNVRVGSISATPVALATPLSAYIAALEAYLLLVDVAIGALPGADPTLAAKILARKNAALVSMAATRLQTQ